MAVIIRLASLPGLTLKACIQRRSDSKYWNTSTNDWSTAPSFSDKDIPLTEGSSENAGRYAGSVSHANIGNAGLCDITIHDADDSNTCLATYEVAIFGGQILNVAYNEGGQPCAGADVASDIAGDVANIQTQIGTAGDGLSAIPKTGFKLASDGLDATPAVYTAKIEFTKDATNSRDEYAVRWSKNGVRVTSGITSPTIQVVKWADGTNLVASTNMTQIGSGGAYKYSESNNRTTAGENYEVITAATIDGATRTFSRWVTRDDT